MSAAKGDRVMVRLTGGESRPGKVESRTVVYRGTQWEFTQVQVLLDDPLPGCACGRCLTFPSIIVSSEDVVPLVTETN